jgi:hypothetical protein
MKNVNDDLLKKKLYLSLILFSIVIYFYQIYFQLIVFVFIYLPAETGAVGVRVGIPAAGRDRDIVPLSELSRDLIVDVVGLGRAKNKFNHHT